jgi:hypothetical protein
VVTHPDHDALLDAALVADPEVEDHARGCVTCRDELHELRSLVDTVRDPSALPAQPPPPHVWDAIEAELAAGPGGEAARAGATVPAADDGASGAGIVQLHAGGGAGRPVVRRARRRVWLPAAAAVLLAAGTGALGWTLGSRQDTGAVVTSTQLLALDSGAVHGEASVTEVGERRVLRVTTDGLAQPDDGFLEVWLLDESASRLVPLGVLDDSAGSFAVPAGVDLGEFPVVDISDEPLDGDPAHSGDSLVRGTLEG